MPQMTPNSWLILFLIFSLNFILFCMMNYHMYMPSSPKSNDLKKLI